MSELDSIIQVTITRETAAVATASFNIPLILATFTTFPERVRAYTDLDAAAADFDSDGPVYTMIQKAFSQDLGRPPQVLVGRRQVDSVSGNVPAVTEGQTYTVVINGSNYSYTAENGDTAVEVVAGLKADFDLGSETEVTFTDNEDGTFDIAVVTPGTGWSVSASDNVSITNGPSTESWTDALDAVSNVNNTWYALLAEVHTAAEIEELANAVQAREKIYVTSSSDVAISGSGDADIGSILSQNAFSRTSLIYHTQANTQYPEAAWVGGVLPQIVGSTSWNFKRAQGVPADTLTDTQRVNLRSKNVNMFTNVAGVNIFQDGVMADGRPMSEIIIADWIKARMQEQIYFRLVNLRKIPFTRAGFTIIENEMRSVLSQAQANGAIDEGWTVTVPDPLAIPANQRAQGIAGVFSFTARLQGEVKKIIIQGTLTI